MEKIKRGKRKDFVVDGFRLVIVEFLSLIVSSCSGSLISKYFVNFKENQNKD